MKIKKYINNKQGVVLIITILLMTLILFLSMYFLNFTVTEKKIAHNQVWSMKSYYLAEAGVNELVWLLQNDASIKNSFENDPSWTYNFQRNSPFGADSGSYSVAITNVSRAEGNIVAVGTINFTPSKTSQRIIKATAFRALGSVGGSSLGDNSALFENNMDIKNSEINFINSSVHVNGNFIIGNSTILNIDHDLSVVGNFNMAPGSIVNVGSSTYAKNEPSGPASEIEMPAVDFDSDDANSLKNKASVVYTQNEFEALLDSNDPLILNDAITYVEGRIDLENGRNLIVNGLLVSDGDFNIGTGKKGSYDTLTVNHIPGQASGVISKSKMDFRSRTGVVDVQGVLYAIDQVQIFAISSSFDVVGGIVGRQINMHNCNHVINITKDEEIVASTLDPSSESPVIMIHHWEDEY